MSDRDRMGSTRLPYFDPIPSRSTDPPTSHAAEPVRWRTGSQAIRLLQSFASLIDATDEEAMENAIGVSPVSEYAKRCSELREAGLIEPTIYTRPGYSGRERMVSTITEAGARVLVRLAKG